jgi:hypothetical protein
VAIRVTADRCAFYNCRFLGWQVYALCHSQLFLCVSEFTVHLFRMLDCYNFTIPEYFILDQVISSNIINW